MNEIMCRHVARAMQGSHLGFALARRRTATLLDQVGLQVKRLA